MVKKLVLVTQAASTCPTYAHWLFQFFGSNITLETFSVEANDFPAMSKDADLYIVAATSTDAFSQVMETIPLSGRWSLLPSRFSKRKSMLCASCLKAPVPCW